MSEEEKRREAVLTLLTRIYKKMEKIEKKIAEIEGAIKALEKEEGAWDKAWGIIKWLIAALLAVLGYKTITGT